LASLNPVLAKMEPFYAYKLYQGFLSFASHVAKSSGGIMGFFTINPAEAKLVKLPMLTPILYTPNGEEE
ncbi:MAG: hypothetical protein WAT26_11320, partial [Saprospiraceae bacterium]